MKWITTLIKEIWYLIFPTKEKLVGIVRYDLREEDETDELTFSGFDSSDMITVTPPVYVKQKFAFVSIGAGKTVKAAVKLMHDDIDLIKKGCRVELTKLIYGDANDDKSEIEYEITGVVKPTAVFDKPSVTRKLEPAL